MTKKKSAATEQGDSDQPRERPGICDKCGSGKFKLRVEDHQLIRKCKECGTELTV